MTNGRRRRMSVLILLLCLVLIAAVIAQMWYGMRYQRNIEYGGAILTATPAEVCPGDTFTYAVDIIVLTGNSVAQVTEGWCRADGICPVALQNTPYFLNFAEPFEISATARRTVPDGLSPGEWELRHCNETRSTGQIDVQCYAVPVVVKDCE